VTFIGSKVHTAKNRIVRSFFFSPLNLQMLKFQFNAKLRVIGLGSGNR